MKNKNIQGLRAIAVLAVVLYHAGFSWIPGGFIGVDVFFVISGFLITQLIVKELKTTGTLNFSQFYARRLRRLLPTAAVVIVTTIGVSRHLISPLRFRDIGIDALSSIFNAANYRFYFSEIDYLNSGDKPSLFLHFWSLSVEEQFYLIWPLLIFIGYKLFKQLGTLALLIPVAGFSFYYSLQLTESNSTLAFYSLPTRAWEFAIGSLAYLCIWKLHRIPGFFKFLFGWTGLAGLIYSFITIKDTLPFPGLIVLIPATSTVLVLLASFHGKFLGSFLISNPLFYFIGAISYSLYLWHWPIYQLMVEVLGFKPTGTNLYLYFALTLTFTLLTYFLVEEPIRNYRRLWPRPKFTFIWAGFLSLISGFVAMTLLGLNLGASDFTTVSPTSEQAPVINVIEQGSQPRNLSADLPLETQVSFPLTLDQVKESQGADQSCKNETTESKPKPCSYGDLKSAQTVVIWGDSKANQWWPALDVAGKKNNFKVVEYTMSFCPAPAFFKIPNFGKPFPQCISYRNTALTEILALKPNLIILSSQRWNSTISKDIEEAYSYILKPISDAGIKSIVISDTPAPREDIPQCLSLHLTNSSYCDSPFNSYDPYPTLQSIGKQWNVPVINPTNWFCTAIDCPAVVNQIIVYRDNSHISTAFAKSLSEKIYPYIEVGLRSKN